MPWHLCSGSCSGSLPTRCWKHPADWLKEHRTFDCEKLFLRGLQTNTATRRAHVSSEERTTGIAWCASAVFLRVSRSPFTLTLKPRITAPSPLSGLRVPFDPSGCLEFLGRGLSGISGAWSMSRSPTIKPHTAQDRVSRAARTRHSARSGLGRVPGGCVHT